MSMVIDIADAIVTALEADVAADEFGISFKPERKLVPAFEIDELNTLRVTVFPKANEQEIADRSRNRHDVTVDIGIQKRIAGDAEVEQLLDLVETIDSRLSRRQLEAVPARYVNSQNQPVYSPEHLTSQNVFTSVLTLTYRALR